MIGLGEAMFSLLGIAVILLFIVVVVAATRAFKRSRKRAHEGVANAGPANLPDGNFWKTALRLAGGFAALLALIAFYLFVFPAPPIKGPTKRE